jgi:hypothetical protein
MHLNDQSSAGGHDNSETFLTASGVRKLHPQSQRHLNKGVGDYKSRMRTSLTRRSVNSLQNSLNNGTAATTGPPGSQLELADPSLQHSPAGRGHHKRQNSRVDVISEKEELGNDGNSLSSQSNHKLDEENSRGDASDVIKQPLSSGEKEATAKP